MADDFTPYSTLKPMFPATLPGWVPGELDKQRIESYRLYEQIYWSVPETFKLVARGTEDKPIYLPAAKTIIETMNRFTATGMSVAARSTILNPATADDIAVYQEVWNNLLTRERFWSKFSGNKRYGLIRGDWLWYIIADPAKPEGSRISIRVLDPGSYFPIPDPNDIDKIVGCHIVDQQLVGEDVLIHKTTYRKGGTPENVGQFITVEEGIYELDDEWGGPKAKPKTVIKPPTVIGGITNLPVYHIRNFDEPSNPFGSSEMRGYERIIAACNQAISDEELALALEGLGAYWTDAPPPTDDAGNIVNWNLGPGRMIEVPTGHTVNRVSGVSSVSSSQEHIAFLIKQLREGSSTPDVAIGNVDVTVAQSGIALSLQFAPILAHSGEKDVSIREVMSQMFYDIQNEWFPVFERITVTGIVTEPIFGDKLPNDRAATLSELNMMFDRNIISAAFYRQECEKLGYVFPADIDTQINAELATKALASDPFGIRTSQELNGGVDNGQGQTQQGNTGG